MAQVFGRRYYEQMPSMGLKSADAAYVLAFSVIMLNTDLHNNQVRPGAGALADKPRGPHPKGWMGASPPRSRRSGV